MASIPAVCDSCGMAFPSGIAVGGNMRDLMLVGNKAGPCPSCGAMGTIPDGLFNAVDGVIEAVSSPGGERGLRDLIRLLEDWQQQPPSPKAVRQALQTEAPQLAPVLQRFAPTNSASLAAWIAVLLAILRLVQGCQERGVEVQQTEIDRVTIETIEVEADKRR